MTRKKDGNLFRFCNRLGRSVGRYCFALPSMLLLYCFCLVRYFTPLHRITGFMYNLGVAGERTRRGGILVVPRGDESHAEEALGSCQEECSPAAMQPLEREGSTGCQTRRGAGQERRGTRSTAWSRLRGTMWRARHRLEAKLRVSRLINTTSMYVYLGGMPRENIYPRRAIQTRQTTELHLLLSASCLT